MSCKIICLHTERLVLNAMSHIATSKMSVIKIAIKSFSVFAIYCATFTVAVGKVDLRGDGGNPALSFSLPVLENFLY